MLACLLGVLDRSEDPKVAAELEVLTKQHGCYLLWKELKDLNWAREIELFKCLWADMTASVRGCPFAVTSIHRVLLDIQEGVAFVAPDLKLRESLSGQVTDITVSCVDLWTLLLPIALQITEKVKDICVGSERKRVLYAIAGAAGSGKTVRFVTFVLCCLGAQPLVSVLFFADFIPTCSI